MFDSVQNNTWLFFPFITVWISVLYEPSFQTLIKCFAFNLTHKRISRLLHMFFKELLHVCILFSYQCSLVLLITHSRQLLYNIMCCFLCQQLFSTFFQLVFALSKKALKTRCFSVVCCCRVQQPWIIYTLPPTKVNNNLQTFSKLAL